MKATCILRLAGGALMWWAAAASGDTLFFKSSGNSLWSSLTNWYYADGMGGYVNAFRLPNAPDNVILLNGPDGQAGVFRVNSMILEGVAVVNGAYSAQNIVMADGSSFTASSITVLSGGTMEIIGSTFGCTLAGTTVVVQGGASMYLTNGTLLTLTGGTFIYDEGAVILTDMCLVDGVPGINTLDILPGAELLTSGMVIVEAVGAPGPFTINNNGTVVCNSGFLELSPSLLISTNNTARFQTVAPGAMILLDPPRIDPGVTFLLFGPGTNSLTGATVEGTLQVGGVDPGTGFFAPGNLALNGTAQVQGAGLIQVASSNGLASTLTATNSIITSTTINIDPGALFTVVTGVQLISNVVNNAGTVVWKGTPGNQFVLGGAASFNNLAGATFNASGSPANIVQAPQGFPSFFNNSGALHIAGGANTTSLGSYVMEFNNNGLLDVQGGAVNLVKGNNSGQFNVGPGATLNFVGPTNFLNPGASFSGVGSLQVNSATLFVNGNVTVPNLTMTGFNPVIDGPGQLTVAGPMSWNGGTAQGTGSLNIGPAGTLTLGGNAVLYQRTLNNSGTINWTGSYFYSGEGAVINNLSGGLFSIQTSYTLVGNNAPPLATFNNFGTVQKSAGSAGTLNVNFNNAGVFQVLTQGVSFTYLYQQTAGSTVVGQGTTLTANGGINLLGGMLDGAGTVSGPLTNSGSVHPGMSPGILTLAAGGGNIYTQSVNGTLQIDLGGLAPGSQYSQLAAGGVPVALGGSLNVNLVNGFVPAAGQQFTILTCASRTGTFPVLNGTYLGNGLVLVPVYSSTNLTLVASNMTILQPLITAGRTGMQGNSLQLTWPSVIGQPYVVQYSTDLSQWFVLSNLVATSTSASVIDLTPIPGVAKRFYRVR